MAKSKKCKLVLNTSYGHVMQPMEFPSISKAVEYAELVGMSGRIFVDGKLVKRV